MATERYQQLGVDPDAYAEPTDRFANFDQALQCMLEDGNFQMPSGMQFTMF